MSDVKVTVVMDSDAYQQFLVELTKLADHVGMVKDDEPMKVKLQRQLEAMKPLVEKVGVKTVG